MNTIRIKGSGIPGKIPTVQETNLKELRVNYYDGDLYIKRYRPGIGSDIVNIGAGSTVSNVLYVTVDGKDTNTGKKLGDAKKTIEAAVSIAKAGDIIKVSSGSYTINNPVIVPDQVSIVGDSLREVTITPANNADLFHIGAGNYFAWMSFHGSPNSNAIFAFDPNYPRYINQSPYIQNCTNFIQNSIGLRIDGRYAIGPLKSMVLDSYTQNQSNGIGISITNEGYAQLVSLFTICNNIGVFCGSGGACDLTNSNSSFGNYALVSDGVGPRKYSGVVTSQAEVNSDTFTINLNTSTYNVSNAIYDNVCGILTVYTSQPHKLSVGMGVSISGLQFSCPSGPTILTYPSGQKGTIFETRTVAPGRFVDSYNLIQANRTEIINTAYDEIAISYPSFVNPNPDKCKRDLGYIIDAVSLDVRDYTNENTINATKKYFNVFGTPINNGLVGEEAQTITAFNKARDLMKLAITNNLTIKNLSLPGDPTNTDPLSCSNVRTFIDNLVSILTTSINAGNLNSIPAVSMASTVFSVPVGVSTLPHTYVSGGTIRNNVVRPFDGQVVYFGELYSTVNNISLVNNGDGYSTPPVVTISPPNVPWGIPAKAVAEISSGKVTNIVIISSGRGYTTTPTISISSPNSGINTAVAAIEMVPTYYSILNSTPLVSGICTITISDNLPYSLSTGTTVSFYKQSRILASGHSLEYIGSGTDLATALPWTGGVAIQENETVAKNGGLVVYTTTDQSGNFRIGDGVVINQQTGNISGASYAKSLFSTMTPFILALGGD